MEKVSVIVPVFNRRELLVRCLDSIAAQTWRPVELIVVDNGSEDGSYETACEWGKDHSEDGFMVRVIREDERGACRARNRGLLEATGDYTVFFDSDDVMRNELIRKGVETLKSDRWAEIACWRCEIHQLDGSERVSPFYPDRAMECHLLHALLRTHGYIASTALFRRVGGWNEDLSCWNDLELGVRMLLELDSLVPSGSESGEDMGDHRGITGIPEILADIYAQKESITGKDFSSKAGKWERSLNCIREEISSSKNLNKRGWLMMLTYREVILAAHYKKENRPDLASDLLRKVFSNPDLSYFKKIALRLIYHYTSFGGRGAWHLARYF